MRHDIIIVAAVSCCLAMLAGSARAGDPPAAGSPAAPPQTAPQVSPLQLRQQQAPALQQQERQQRKAGDETLRGRQRPLMDQCTRLLRQQWPRGGLVQLLSARLIDGNPAYVRGHASFPGVEGGREVHRYHCYYNGRRTAIVKATVGGIVLEPAPELPPQ